MQLLALYQTLSLENSFAPARLQSKHAAVVTEYAAVRFVLGATFENSSDGATSLFLALMHGLPPSMGFSEVREDLLGLFLHSSDADDSRTRITSGCRGLSGLACSNLLAPSIAVNDCSTGASSMRTALSSVHPD